mmetsp:Transcript_84570/g.176916  ORF Transcript_84570/g.176916 Transcript_84570/m.176916 type:complete len:215 (+) Transcript_84570:138-782(+)
MRMASKFTMGMGSGHAASCFNPFSAAAFKRWAAPRNDLATTHFTRQRRWSEGNVSKEFFRSVRATAATGVSCDNCRSLTFSRTLPASSLARSFWTWDRQSKSVISATFGFWNNMLREALVATLISSRALRGALEGVVVLGCAKIPTAATREVDPSSTLASTFSANCRARRGAPLSGGGPAGALGTRGAVASSFSAFTFTFLASRMAFKEPNMYL